MLKGFDIAIWDSSGNAQNARRFCKTLSEVLSVLEDQTVVVTPVGPLSCSERAALIAKGAYPPAA
jgi:hypothetical protein